MRALCALLSMQCAIAGVRHMCVCDVVAPQAQPPEAPPGLPSYLVSVLPPLTKPLPPAAASTLSRRPRLNCRTQRCTRWHERSV